MSFSYLTGSSLFEFAVFKDIVDFLPVADNGVDGADVDAEIRDDDGVVGTDGDCCFDFKFEEEED